MEKLIINGDEGRLSDKYVFVDNDFLGILFGDAKIFKDFVSVAKGNLIIDPLTDFEFMRDLFDPARRVPREAFLYDSVFVQAESHSHVHQELMDNALILSRIYSHQKDRAKTGPKAASIVDLFLGARLMKHGKNSVLVTGNKKDFPSCVFDTVCVLNYEQPDGSMRAISVVTFNRQKFEVCYQSLLDFEKSPNINTK